MCEAALLGLDSVTDCVIALRNGRVDYANAAAAQLLGVCATDLIGSEFAAVAELQPNREKAHTVDSDLTPPREPFHPDAQPMILVRPGRRIAVEIASLPVKAGAPYTELLVIHDRSRESALRQSVAEKARYDKLTGLLNRNEVDRCLANLVDEAEATGNCHALLYIDLDQFKVVNDTCGHMAGDELLRMLGMHLRGCVQFGDIVGRLGGDEFGVLLSNVRKEEATEVARRICRSISDIRFAWATYSFAVGASIGITIIDEYTRKADVAMRQADSACYAAKEEGRNRVHLFTEDDRDLQRRHGEMEWLSQINKAMDEDRMRIVHQRIAPIQPGIQRDMAEVLLRIESPTGEIITPGAFIPAAERYNLMPVIDRWVIDKMLAMLEPINAADDSIERYTINLSGLSMGDPAFLQHIIKGFERTGVDPSRICFEVTETAAVTSFSQAVRFMALLREIGCRFALDDFGSGMSSFGYLRELPVDYLKIDGMFVRSIAYDPFHRAIVKSIIEVDHAAGMKTIAEHVDSEYALDLLRTLGADYVQGYHVSMPVPFPAAVSAA